MPESFFFDRRRLVTHIAKKIVLSFSFLLLCAQLFGQSTGQIAFQGAENFEYTEKADLRIR